MLLLLAPALAKAAQGHTGSKPIGIGGMLGAPKGAEHVLGCLGCCVLPHTPGCAVHPQVLQTRSRQTLHTQIVTSQSSLMFDIKHIFCCLAAQSYIVSVCACGLNGSDFLWVIALPLFGFFFFFFRIIWKDLKRKKENPDRGSCSEETFKSEV